MKILLSGEQQIGKSYSIKKFLEEKINEKNKYSSSKFSFGGFHTLSKRSDLPYDKEINNNIYIDKGSNYLNPIFDDNYIIKKRSYNSINTNVFDNFAINFFDEDTNNKNLIILDEIGFLESSSTIFKEKVIKILTNEKNVLGVIRDKNTEFLNTIRELNNIIFYKVDCNNIKNLTSFLLNQFDFL
ncbi:MAG: nucleoside-triphosphatase [Eubacteriales bacterium]|nr:nucleoside-triphosphatase [Eubacteriales bacterium]